MKEIVNDRFIIKVVSFQSSVEVSCPEKCYAAINGLPSNQCVYLNMRNLIENNKLQIAIIKLLIKNISLESLKLYTGSFDVVDSLGFTFQPFALCNELHKDNRAITSSYELPPNTQIYFILYTYTFDESTQLSKVHFTDNNRICHTIDVSEVDNDITTTEEKLRIENYKLSEEFNKLQESRIKNEKIIDENEDEYPDGISYKTEEDDEFLYIISDEKDKHISFHRRFDLKKSNYNWVNIGEPLITLVFDEDNGYKFGECDIDCPTTGVFEFDKKRFIAYNEVVCKIRKYSQEQKVAVFVELEKQAIKETLLNKERKRKLEREALDELIADGLVFNTYIDKMGNRTKITNELANAVWNRDGGSCCYCSSKENLEFDHIIPISKGGATTFQNLQLLCKACNIRKSNKIG